MRDRLAEFRRAAAETQRASPFDAEDVERGESLRAPAAARGRAPTVRTVSDDDGRATPYASAQSTPFATPVSPRTNPFEAPDAAGGPDFSPPISDTSSAPFATPQVEMHATLLAPAEGGAQPTASPAESREEATGAFLAAVDEIKRRIARIEGAAATLDTLHREAQAAVSTEEARDAATRIAAVSAQATGDARFVRQALKAAARETEAALAAPPGDAALSQSDVRMRRGQQQKWTKRFLAATQRLERTQSAHRERYRRQLERQMLIVKPDATAAEIAAVVDAGDEAQMTQHVFAMASRSAAAQGLAAMRERHAEILAIERSVSELQQMVVDMALVVDQQGLDIDRVEAHIDTAVAYTEAGAVELRGAARKQRAALRRRWISLAVCLVVLVVLAIVLVFALKDLYRT